MKNKFYFDIILFCFLVSCSSRKQRGAKSPDGMVYICTGKYSKAYHIYSQCYGLSNCSGEKDVITLQEAKEEGRHLCRFCKKGGIK